MSKFGPREQMISGALVASPLAIEEHLLQLHDEMEDATALLVTLSKDAAHKKAIYEKEHAKAMLRARLQDDLSAASDRKAWADTEVGTPRMDLLVAEGLHASQKAVLSTKETQAMILMALLRSVRGAIGER